MLSGLSGHNLAVICDRGSGRLVRILVETLIQSNPRFWRVALWLLLVAELMLLAGVFRIDLKLLDAVLVAASLYITFRLQTYAHTAAMAANVAGKRVYITGYAALDKNTQIFAGDFGNALFGVGARVLADPENAEFLISLEGETGVMRCDDRHGYVEQIALRSNSKLATAAYLGGFVVRSRLHETRGRGPRVRFDDARVKRALIVLALLVQLGLACRYFIFALEPQQSGGFGEYLFNAVGVPITYYMFLRKANRSCRLMLPEISGRTVFISGAGRNMSGRAVELGHIARLLGSQGAAVIGDSDIADIRVDLNEDQCHIQLPAGDTFAVFIDDESIITELKWRLRALNRKVRRSNDRSATAS